MEKRAVFLSDEIISCMRERAGKKERRKVGFVAVGI